MKSQLNILNRCGCVGVPLDSDDDDNNEEAINAMLSHESSKQHKGSNYAPLAGGSLEETEEDSEEEAITAMLAVLPDTKPLKKDDDRK